MRKDVQQQIDSLWAAVRKLEQAAQAQPVQGQDAPSPALPHAEIPALQSADPVPALSDAAQQSTEIPAETMAVIAASISALLGRQVRIRSVKLLEQPQAAASWATQGRIAIHSSHNTRRLGG